MRFPQVVIEHQRFALDLLRSIRKSRQSGFAHGRSRPGLAIRSASHARIARSAPRNTVLLGGDLHQNYVCAVPQDASHTPDKNNPVIASEFCGTSISSRSGTYQAKLDAIMSTNPQVLYARCEERGYGLVDITPASMMTELRAVANPMRADSAVYTLAKFAVQDKQPGPRKI